MRQLTQREKRTVRFATVGLVIYLGLFYGLRGWNNLEAARVDYRELVVEAERTSRDLRAQQNNLLLLEKLKATSRIEPEILSPRTLVAESSAAIQKAAAEGRIELGPIREGPGNRASGELATMQLEGVGEVGPILTLLHRLDTLGYPLIVEAVQIAPEAQKPGSVKLHLQIVILDFERWTATEVNQNG